MYLAGVIDTALKKKAKTFWMFVQLHQVQTNLNRDIQSDQKNLPRVRHTSSSNAEADSALSLALLNCKTSTFLNTNFKQCTNGAVVNTSSS